MKILTVFDRQNYDTALPRHLRESVRAVIFQDHKIALMYIQKHNIYVFPGGGIEHGETPQEALVRETREEAGLIVRPQSIVPLGMVTEIRRDLYVKGIFEQRDSFFTCEIEVETLPPNLTPNEQKSGYQLVFISLEEAIAANEAEIRAGTRFSERETYVLKLLQGKTSFDT